MHGCTSVFMLIVNAEIDSMGGVIDTGTEVGISSKPSLQQSSDLEKTQAELRQTFTAAEQFRRELEFLQKGGDPLDLKPGNAASISFQSTSLTDRHLTSEAKGSFAITASPHGDSVESSGRLGAPVCEPNSADNLMLFDGANTTSLSLSKLENIGRHVSKESGDSAVLELPKKSYKRRIRSRPNRDGARKESSSTDAAPSRGAHFLPFRHASNSKPKSPNELDGVPAGQSTLGPPHGPYSAVLDANVMQNTQENHQEQVDLCPPHADTEKSENFVGPTNGIGNMEEVKVRHDDGNNGGVIPTKVLDSESSCGQTSQRFDGYNGNGLGSKEVVDVEGNNNLVAEKDDKILNIEKDKNDDGSVMKEEEGLKGSESCLQNELKSSVCTRKVVPDGCTTSETETETKPHTSNDTVRHCADVAEQNVCSQENLKLATKEHEDKILENARFIEAKRKRIAELSVTTLPLERRLKSQWDFVLEEMSWLANDFAQERLWKVTAAAQISKKAAFSSRLRFQKQSSLQKQKEVAHNLSEAVIQFWNTIQVKQEESESKDHAVGIQGYAMRFLEYNNSKSQYKSTQPPLTHDLGIMDLSWEDNLTEENLFYTVPPGAIEAYRKAIESHLLQFERTGSSMQEEVDTSGYDAVAENAYEEDEGETNTYYSPGVFEGHRSTKGAQKRRKNFKFDRGRSYEMGGGDVSFMHTGGTQPSVLSGKRPATSLNVSIPTKRVRTASRQRIISPFHAGTSGCVQTPHRTDASSGDTNSFQDEHSSLHGGSHIPNNMEAESVGDYEKQLQFDSMEVSNRPKKKKKGSTFDHRWQLDSSFQNDQKDHSRRRLDAHQFDSNGSSVASQMSNMSNPNKIMKLLVRDRGRKAKALKTHVGQPGSGSPWSLFEDQALVVLVHDMGPNWELISDAINSTLQFKCIFRKSKECKERHKILMDRNTGDGADSGAEDSGSSQPYPSTLPGIPEGSARQLFQRLQGPMEEDTLKSHFEKIIMIGHKQHYRRLQNDNQDPKQLQPPHSSHAFALSQVIPNNLNGGPVLTPLELSEPISSSPDGLPVGFQGPGGLPVLNHATVPPMLPGSGSGPTHSNPGSSNSVHGTNLPSASASLSPAVREGRYGIPNDQQKLQQYNQMLSARNANQSSLPPGSHSVTDRGVRMLPAGSGMGVMCGMTRGIKMARPSSMMMNSTSLLTSGSPSPSSGQGNSTLRSREAVHMVRPNQNTDHQKMAVGDVPMQQSGGTPPPLPPVQSYPLHHHHHHQPPRPISPQQTPRVLNPNSHLPHHFQGPTSNPQHPAFGMRFAKERQLQQQRLRQQQQQQFPTSNPVMPHVQPQPQDSQLPASSPQSPSISPIGISPMPQVPQKHPAPAPHGIIRNPQMAKQPRPRQQFQQPKLMKGSGRGSSMATDVNGFSGGQSSADKNEQKPMHPMMYSGKQSVVPLSQQQTTYSGQTQQKASDNTPNQNNHQKLGTQVQKQTVNPQKLLINRKVNPSVSKMPPVSQTSTPVTIPPSCHDANSSETPVAGLSPPQTGGDRVESGGGQWQQQKPPS